MPGVAVPAVTDQPLCRDAQGREREWGFRAATLSQLLRIWSGGSSRAGNGPLDLTPSDFYAEFIQLLFACKFLSHSPCSHSKEATAWQKSCPFCWCGACCFLVAPRSCTGKSWAHTLISQAFFLLPAQPPLSEGAAQWEPSREGVFEPGSSGLLPPSSSLPGWKVTSPSSAPAAWGASWEAR